MPNKDKLAVGNKWFMYQITNSLKDKLKKYGNDPRIKGREDEYIKEQLARRGKENYWYPEISKDISSGNLGTENSYYENPKYQQWLDRPENEALKNQQNKKHGELYNTKVSSLRPDQQQLSQDITKAAQQTLPGIYQKLGQPTSLEQPTTDLIMKLINQHNQGGAMGDEFLSGFGAFPGLQQNLQGLGQGAQQLGRGAQQVGQGLGQGAQAAGQFINPYLQSAAEKGQSYLSAAQPYAQKAASLGGDAINSIRSGAMQAGNQTVQGLGNLLGMLKGRI